MTMDFNLDDLFAKMESESKFDSVLYFPKKGDNVLLAMLPPMEHNGEVKLALAVEGEYKGQKNKQFILRCLKWNLVGGKVQDQMNPQYIGVVLSPTFVQQIAVAKTKEYVFAAQEQNFIELAKAEKVSLIFRPQIKKIPDEMWEKGMMTPTWEELLQANEKSKEAFAKKAASKNGVNATKDESNPWDEQ